MCKGDEGDDDAVHSGVVTWEEGSGPGVLDYLLPRTKKIKWKNKWFLKSKYIEDAEIIFRW